MKLGEREHTVLYSNGFCSSMGCFSTSSTFFLLPSDLLLKLELLLWRLLSLKADLYFRLFALFHSSRKLMPDWFFFFFSFSSPFFLFSCPSPWQSWLFYSCFSTALILPCLISQGNEEVHHTTLRMQFPANCVLLNCPLKRIISEMECMSLCSWFQKHLWVLEALRQLSSTFSGFNSFTCSGGGASWLHLITWKVTLAALPIKLSVLVKQTFFSLRFLFD